MEQGQQQAGEDTVHAGMVFASKNVPSGGMLYLPGIRNR
jgi:hypothetical protein